MFKNQTSLTAGTKWTIKQCLSSTIVLAWAKRNVSFDDKGHEVALTVYKTGFVDPDQDFEMTEVNSNYKLVTTYWDAQMMKALGKRSVESGVKMTSEPQVLFKIEGRKNQIGNFVLPIFLLYEREQGGELSIDLHDVVIEVTNDDVDNFTVAISESCSDDESGIGTEASSAPRRPESDPEKVKRKVDRLLTVLKPYQIPNGLINDAGKGSIICWEKLYPLTMKCYSCKFALLIFYEELQMEFDIRKFDLSSQSFTSLGRSFLLEVPGLAEKRPSVLCGDKIAVKASFGDSVEAEVEGEVVEVRERAIVIKFAGDQTRTQIRSGGKFDVRFKVNRYPNICMNRALEIIASPLKSSFWSKFLFPTPDVVKKAQFNPMTTPVEMKKFFNPLIEKNKEQRLAVKSILEGGIKGVPYIIFGPPGTGKTVTLVEAIIQTWYKNPSARILAAASSNSAADLLTTRILEHISDTFVLRYYASSFEEKRVPAELKPVSTFARKIHTNMDLKMYSIVVCTFITARRVANFNSWGNNCFEYVFLDEAGHAIEPEALNAVAGILDTNRGQVVIAGDPKQLGPVIHSRLAIKHELQMSLLERLMEMEVYKPDPDTGEYNHRLITKLVRNFRSHREILKIPSDLFYDSKLVPMADPSKIESLVNWTKLPKLGFPIIFEGIVGTDNRDQKSPSYFNIEEAVIVMDYLTELLTIKQPGIEEIEAKDIAIISPYRGQIKKLVEMVKVKAVMRPDLDWNDVTIGSTEELQGQERKVIIITTVRSQVEMLEHDFKFNLGFLRNPKRFNVALTRAQALLIVVGNPMLLSVDNNWKVFIDFVIKKGGYRGVHEQVFRTKGVTTLKSRFAELSADFENLTLSSSNDYLNGFLAA